MGQPQFMPSSYLRYAVDFEGNGRRDIWTSKPDVLASIANYLQRPAGVAANRGASLSSCRQASPARRGATPGNPWGNGCGWRARRQQPPRCASRHPGRWSSPTVRAAEAFLGLRQFRRHSPLQPSDYYALAVGLLGDRS